MTKISTTILLLSGMAIAISAETGCGALQSKWKCTPSRSCDWYKEFLKNLGKYSTGDQKFKELKAFYDDRKCGEGHVYCSSDGKFPRDSGDLPELKRCQLSESPSGETAVQSGGCGALHSKWKCIPSRSCDWYKEFVKNLGKYSTGDQKFKELKEFYDDRKCGEGHVYCSSDGKFPRDSDDLPKLKICPSAKTVLPNPSDVPVPDKLKVVLMNDVKDQWSKSEGIYALASTKVNEKPHWLQEGGEDAIWYDPKYTNWKLALASRVGSSEAKLLTDKEDTGTALPHETPWKYFKDRSNVIWTFSDDILVTSAKVIGDCNSFNYTMIKKINAYRRSQNNYQDVKCSRDLSSLAREHARDQNSFIDRGGEFKESCNPHSWHDEHPCCYKDIKTGDCMWKAYEIRHDSKISHVYEVTGQSSATYNFDSALESWKDSPGHRAVIAGEDFPGEDFGWNANTMRGGCGYEGKFVNCFFSPDF